MGATHVLPGIQGLPYRLKPDQLHLFDTASTHPKAYTVIISHLFGGATMGRDKLGVPSATVGVKRMRSRVCTSQMLRFCRPISGLTHSIRSWRWRALSPTEFWSMTHESV